MPASTPVASLHAGAAPDKFTPQLGMILTIARILAKVIGTIACVIGVAVLGIALATLARSIGERPVPAFLFLLPVVGIGTFLIHVGYMAWFRFSPAAVRHICRVMALFAFTLFPIGPWQNPEPGWHGVALVAWALAMWFAYAVVTDRLNRRIFAEGTPDARHEPPGAREVEIQP